MDIVDIREQLGSMARNLRALNVWDSTGEQLDLYIRTGGKRTLYTKVIDFSARFDIFDERRALLHTTRA